MQRPQVLPGTPARSETPLRPAGKVSIGGSTFDARASGQWIDADQPVLVHRVDGFGLVVGPPGTTPLPRDALPSGSEGQDPDSHRLLSRLERHLSGLIAFGALGTGGSGIVLLVLAFRVRPEILLYLIAPVLIAGAALGALGYGLICLGVQLWERSCRLADRAGPTGVLVRMLRSPIDLILVLALLSIALIGLTMVLTDPGPSP
jgi:hypothetical protein